MSETLLFKVFCLEQYKEAHRLNGRETTQVFSAYGVFDYLQSFYDVLHTTSAEYMIEEIDLFLKEREALQ